jgi:hypothetical protein
LAADLAQAILALKVVQVEVVAVEAVVHILALELLELLAKDFAVAHQIIYTPPTPEPVAVVALAAKAYLL